MILWYFFWWAALGLTMPYVPVFLKGLGFTYTQIGQLSALSALAGFLTQNFIGGWSDRLGRRRPFIFAGSLVAATVFFLFPYFRSYEAFVVLFTLSGLGMYTALTTSSALVLDLSPPEGAAGSFARVRIWGTLGFIAMMILGWAVPAVLSSYLFRVVPLVYLIAGATILFVREPVHHEGRGAGGKLWDGLKLLGRPGVPMLLLVVAVLHGSLQAVSASLVLWLNSLGAESRIVHLCFIVSGLVEIPFMLSMGKWSDRYGRRPLLAITAVALPIRLLLYSWIVNPWWAPAVQTMHGLTFGVLAVVPMAYMNDVTPEDQRAAGQGLLNAVMAGAVALGPLVMGILTDWFGFSLMYRLFALAAGSAGLMLFLFLRESNPHAAPAETALPPRVRPYTRPVAVLFDRSPLYRGKALRIAEGSEDDALVKLP
ncbi:MAG: MFS transporter [Armatimonadetes bacterium]|nr:MFS transporter [Armatimonadota bacterium]